MHAEAEEAARHELRQRRQRRRAGIVVLLVLLFLLCLHEYLAVLNLLLIDVLIMSMGP